MCRNLTTLPGQKKTQHEILISSALATQSLILFFHPFYNSDVDVEKTSRIKMFPR